MKYRRRLSLFVRIVWRRFDSRDIPQPYRNDERIPWRTAWYIAKMVHP